jgi:protoporphyrinogen oxidase
MISILGAGIAGISAGYHLNKRGKESIIYEKRDRWGGLCDNFEIGNGFLFDYFIHLSFTNSDYVKQLFQQSSTYISHTPVSSNYYKGYWLKHPAQNNLAPLSTNEKVKIITDFVQRNENLTVNNYRDWLRRQFGEYFSENFPEKYTLKYWTIKADKLDTDWLGGRFSLPPLENVLKGAFEEQEENFYYAKEMRYPTKGGYKSFLNKMASECRIKTGKKVIEIDLRTKRMLFEDNTEQYYEQIISTLPIPELIKCIKDVPKNVKEASRKLLATSGQLASFGFNRPDIPKDIWFYIYDEDIIPARAYSPSIKSCDNVPEGKSSLQFESYFSKYTPHKYSEGDLIEHIANKGVNIGLWDINDIEVSDYREVKYANVVYDLERAKSIGIVHAFLLKNNICVAGRFGEWAYLWSDQSLISGKNIADEI